jgi:hypothetical protein
MKKFISNVLTFPFYLAIGTMWGISTVLVTIIDFIEGWAEKK